MTEKIKRWDYKQVYHSWGDQKLIPDDTGEFVRFDDYSTLEAELQQVKAERDELKAAARRFLDKLLPLEL
jgi:hypothetical protein